MFQCSYPIASTNMYNNKTPGQRFHTTVTSNKASIHLIIDFFYCKLCLLLKNSHLVVLGNCAWWIGHCKMWWKIVEQHFHFSNKWGNMHVLNWHHIIRFVMYEIRIGTGCWYLATQLLIKWNSFNAIKCACIPKCVSAIHFLIGAKGHIIQKGWHARREKWQQSAKHWYCKNYCPMLQILFL